MASKKKTASRTSVARAASPPRSTPKKKRETPPAVKWVLRLARPRTAGDFLTLLFASLGVATAIFEEVGQFVFQRTPNDLWVSAGLLFVALASRLSFWWKAEVSDMTAERGRNYLASILLILVAISLSWHVVVSSLRVGSGYLLPGILDSGLGAIMALSLMVAVALALFAGVPLGRWVESVIGTSFRSLSSLREPRMRQTVSVEELPAFLDDVVQDNGPRSVVDDETPLATRNGSDSGLTTEIVLTAENGPQLPPLDTFIPAPKGPTAPLDVEIKSQRIEETLASFNVGARVVGHHCGPVVTQFDVQPDRGVKVRRITELQNDLALALAAPTIRIQAPVPGKPVVGIEIPNASASMVGLRDLLESEEYVSAKSPLKVALGKDVAGVTKVIDLARMPHLLIAGATGSGKSVCVNGIISCLLYQNTPEQVRLMMVDPKMVELTVYNGVPHLLSPVVTEMDKVVGVLQWALREMERRYRLFAETTVRNIGRYNEKTAEAGGRGLPYIVLIVDELADLMMVAPEEVEDAICRLAQLARAAGIHLVIATQRPSVDVVTGLIKANFPARIAFQMTSQVDSRTILDTAGAEKLLGRGDMLYMPPDAPKSVRLQGAYLSDSEIETLVEFWHGSALHTSVPIVPAEDFVAAEKAASETEDGLIGEAVHVVREYKHASVSLLQRRLKVGYSRASRIMDELEERGIVGPADGSRQRPVLGDSDSFGS